MNSRRDRPKAILFDIGGVVVASPFQAILDYERTHSIPLGYINFAISRSGADGAWSRLERGTIPLDDSFFAAFQADLTRPDHWRAFWARDCDKEPEMTTRSTRPVGASTSANDNADAPALPSIDAKVLFWRMMRTSRTPDPHIASSSSSSSSSSGNTSAPRLVLGALSNTVRFPPGIRDDSGAAFDPALAAPPPSAGRARRAPRSAEPGSGADIRAPFDVFVSSAHAGVRKPDPGAYRLAVARLGCAWRERYGCAPGAGDELRAEDVLFLDDIGANLKAARGLGMRTLKVELGRTERAVRELEAVVGVKLTGDGDDGGEDRAKARI
ncbi:hypothetical protein BDY21DRAFT_389765 [Lineolata rhizophorae]|uniref:HAD-like domain-containing protein n=1 Tax=Lineolata rhizophorae TaxID=578093 RepID=A0A6A6PE33_9PEZI|nr:hypothetical protein BDY21DRAFT_389765 [Lineolata rhizophorae]